MSDRDGRVNLGGDCFNGSVFEEQFEVVSPDLDDQAFGHDVMAPRTLNAGKCTVRRCDTSDRAALAFEAHAVRVPVVPPI